MDKTYTRKEGFTEKVAGSDCTVQLKKGAKKDKARRGKRDGPQGDSKAESDEKEQRYGVLVQALVQGGIAQDAVEQPAAALSKPAEVHGQEIAGLGEASRERAR